MQYCYIYYYTIGNLTDMHSTGCVAIDAMHDVEGQKVNGFFDDRGAFGEQ